MRAIGITVIAFVFIGIAIYATFDMRRDHNQISRISGRMPADTR